MRLVFFFFIFLPTLALADELRIVDTSGIIRAVREVDKPATVTAKFEGGAANDTRKTITLKNLDGVHSSLAKEGAPGSKVVFLNVSPGIWEISGSTSFLLIRITK